jgi:hypothetical protein
MPNDGATKEGSEEPTPRPAIGPLVFISHDSRDADLAEALSKLLSSVSAGMLKTFRSSDHKGVQGIDYGVEWYPELMRKLDAASDVVCLLTARSLGRPWILYEAGVAKGKLDIPVHGVALGVPLARVSTGPFAQFHNCDDNADSLAKLVEQLTRRLPHADPDHDTVMGQVDSFKTKIEEILAKQETTGEEPEAVTDETSSAKLFEEIKIMFQDLPSRIETVAERAGRGKFLGRRFHPGMLEELVMMTSRGEPNVGVAALIFTSFFRDDLPWLYTMAVELYRASLTDNREALNRAYEAFVRAVEGLDMGPFLHEMLGPSRREIHMLLHELPRLLDHFAPPRLEAAAEADAGAPDEDDS